MEFRNNYCIEQNINYKVLETKYIEKSYQKQQWALVKCPNENHEAYWVWWNNFHNGYRCKLCHYEINGLIMWDKNKAIEFYSKYNLNIINIENFKSIDKRILCINKDGFKVFASITNLKADKIPSPFQYNKFAVENMNHYCKLYRPDYELISNKYINIKTKYLWKYIGNMLPENENRLFELSADSFIHGGSGHPYFSKSKGIIMFE